MLTVISWLLYAASLIGLAPALWLALSGRDGRSLFDGHIAIAVSFALTCVSLGLLVGNYEQPKLWPTVVACVCIVISVTLRFFGGRRAREVNQFVDAIERAQAKQAQKPD